MACHGDLYFISLTTSSFARVSASLTPQACHKLTIFYCVKNNNIVYIHLHSVFFCYIVNALSGSSCGSSNVQINPYRMSLEACLAADAIESWKLKHKFQTLKGRGMPQRVKKNFTEYFFLFIELSILLTVNN